MKIEQIGAATLINADCRVAMAVMDENSVDAIVCDPPYGLSFMGKGWDHGVPGKEFWVEALRVAKPGAYLLAAGGQRTHHRLMCGIENAGWEIRDVIMHVFGSGFPKSHNGPWGGTALKPAYEPWILCRKPLIGTVAANVQQYGTGGLNIDGCRVPTEENLNGGAYSEDRKPSDSEWVAHGGTIHSFAGKSFEQPQGRWPANLIHDGSDEVRACFPYSKSGALTAEQQVNGGFKGTVNCYGTAARGGTAEYEANEGSAARFFKSCELEDIEWLVQNLHPSLAPIAEDRLPLQNVLDCIVQSDAVTSALPEGTHLNALKALSTTATASESKLIATSVIQAIQNFALRCLRAWQQERLSPADSRANVVATREPTGTMMITVSHWKSDGSAEPVIFSITQQNSELGGVGSRFKYCAKASKSDRDSGGVKNVHSTVKPTELMRYLCRLVTPPGGTVLDPFMGSGSTGKAALKEGFNFIGIELDEEHGYFDIACARVQSAVK